MCIYICLYIIIWYPHSRTKFDRNIILFAVGRYDLSECNINFDCRKGPGVHGRANAIILVGREVGKPIVLLPGPICVM